MISLDEIKQARSNIGDRIHQTPMMPSQTLSSFSGNPLFLKGEHLQKTGSFKIRGAAHKVQEVVGQGARHVVAASSGNHGQAVAYIAKELGVRATIIIPENAVASKENAIRDYGAQVVYGGTTSKTRLAKAEKLATEDGAVFIPPYDDPLIMAGQGTVGLEILEQVEDVDRVYVPIGGGGLISGIATALKETRPEIQVIGVEPERANDTWQSLESGKIVSIAEPATIADGLRSLQPGDLTFAVMQKYLDDVLLVSEAEIKSALSLLVERTKQWIEPSGAVSVAAALANNAGAGSRKTVAVISGGNMALDRVQALMDEQ